MEKSRDSNYKLLKKLVMPVFIYPFLIKGYRFLVGNPIELSKLFKIMEVLAFRYTVIRSGAYINSRLNKILFLYHGPVEELGIALKDRLNSENHWSDSRLKKTLDGYMYSTPVVNYLLWQYEASIQNRGYELNAMSFDDELIEHVSPQTPPIGEKIAVGYEVNSSGNYSDEFLEDYLHCLGNLVLISGSHNRAIGNVAFKEKLSSYLRNPLLNQQVQIQSFSSGNVDNPIWDIDAINRRHNVLLSFSMDRWSF
jgi:hypothetical protein